MGMLLPSTIYQAISELWIVSEALDKIVGNGLFWIWIIGNAALVMASDSSAAFLHGGRFWGYLIIFNITVISIGLLYVQLLAGPRWEREYENEQIEHNKEKMAEENMILDLIRMAEEKGLNLVNELYIESYYDNWKEIQKGGQFAYGKHQEVEDEVPAMIDHIERKVAAYTREVYEEGDLRPTYEEKQQAWEDSDEKPSIYHPGSCINCSLDFFENHLREELPLDFYWTDINKTKLLVLCTECARKMKLLPNQKTEKSRSRNISERVQDAVWNRDGGKCVQCSSNENLEFDHIIPFSKGGANTKRNIQLLCESCNRSKSDSIG